MVFGKSVDNPVWQVCHWVSSLTIESLGRLAGLIVAGRWACHLRRCFRRFSQARLQGWEGLLVQKMARRHDFLFLVLALVLAPTGSFRRVLGGQRYIRLWHDVGQMLICDGSHKNINIIRRRCYLRLDARCCRSYKRRLGSGGGRVW